MSFSGPGIETQQQQVHGMQLADEQSYRIMTTDEMRRWFLIEALFEHSRAELVCTNIDWAIAGGIVPSEQPLALQAGREIACSYFCERREIGVLDLGATGTIAVDGGWLAP
jgi:4-deoxy-L-threo-5-hexosulose-uronate ketol-isomerase